MIFTFFDFEVVFKRVLELMLRELVERVLPQHCVVALSLLLRRFINQILGVIS